MILKRAVDSGAWVLRATRMPVQTGFENLETGISIDEIARVFDVTLEENGELIQYAEAAGNELPRSPVDTVENCAEFGAMNWVDGFNKGNASVKVGAKVGMGVAILGCG